MRDFTCVHRGTYAVSWHMRDFTRVPSAGISRVSDVRASRVSCARVAPRVRVGVASVSVLRENKQTKR